jgi:hypothetical protein
VLVMVLGAIWWQRYAIEDWFKLRGYVPPQAVVQLADQDGMQPYTRHLFYLNRPQLPTTVAAFRQGCPENQDTVVLGCYHPGEDGIYVYDVQDSSLAGIQQVTAAHEALHAIYERLSGDQRQQLNSELEAYYANGLTDATVKSEITIYQKTEPHDVDNEMSCVFGTEVALLPPALEQYYAKYFTSRQQITGYYQQYQAQFTSRRQQVTADDTQLACMKRQVDSLENSLSAQGKSLDTQKTQLQQLLNSGQTAAYNAAISGYNAQVQSYNASVDSVRQQITAYNQLVDARNSIAGQLTTLAQAIDTRVPATTQ